MAHYAHITDGIVDNVIVIEQKALESGIVGNPSEWVQTSYNTHGGQHPEGHPLRYNYAGIGYTYDIERDAFVSPSPYASWILDEDTCTWIPPTLPPDEERMYRWDEDGKQWLEIIAE